ncbi:MAG: hypothetical protein HY244_09480 [Rhizobiales bacterium]|nr:hypothetical protein [Hyphomicrobiales bacterium]
MADYHPLISRAVAGLDKNTGENRRVLYERARTALVNQLRGVEPALEESDITRERLALEEAIRKVEAEAAKRSRPDEDLSHEPPREQPSSLTDHGLRDFRDSMAEAEGLGDAAAEATRSAHARFDAVQERPHPPGEGATSQPEHYFEPPAAEPSRPPVESQAFDRPPPAAEDPHTRQPPAESYEPDVALARPPRSYGRIVKYAVLLLLIAGIAGGGYWQRHTIGTLVASLTKSTPAPKPRETVQPAGKPKIADRIGASSDNSNSATAPAAAVAQKAVLYEQDSSNPEGKRFVGSALWRTETVSPGPGLAPELAVRADVEIPERRMRMTWSLRSNTDKALPASHTIEVMFTLPADFDQGGIGEVPGVFVKQNEQSQQRGLPLTGLAVKVTNGYFLIGLSAVEFERQRNIQFLKERDWFEVPITYTSGKRALLAIEKGTPGSRAFEEAFRAWGQ